MLTLLFGLGVAWPDFVPGGHYTMDAGQSGFVQGGMSVAGVEHEYPVEVGARIELAHFEGREDAGSIPHTYSYVPYGLLAGGRLVFRDRAWLSIELGYYAGRNTSSATSNDRTVSTVGEGLVVSATAGGTIARMIGAYADVTELVGEGPIVSAGLAITIR